MAKQDQLQVVLDEAERTLQEMWQPVQQGASRWWHTLTHPEEASFHLGCNLVAQGLYEEAKFRFKFTLWRKPNHAGAWYNLAICYLAMGEKGQGIAALKKALSLRPNSEIGLFLLATIDDGRFAEGKEPHTTPNTIVQGEFGESARDYDVVQLGEYGYNGPQIVYDEILRLCGNNVRFKHMLDAGCGTGLCGELLRPLAEKLTGVDLVPRMLKRARRRKDDEDNPLYDELIEADIRTHLLHSPVPVYDAIVAMEVMPIIGGLTPVFDGVAKALKPGGWFFFNVSLMENRKDGYRLDPAVTRFEHGSDYLRALGERDGLIPVSLRKVALYDDQESHLAVLRKPG
jgi:predicted TPR repeat methyltransferase